MALNKIPEQALMGIRNSQDNEQFKVKLRQPLKKLIRFL